LAACSDAGCSLCRLCRFVSKGRLRCLHCGVENLRGRFGSCGKNTLAASLNFSFPRSACRRKHRRSASCVENAGGAATSSQGERDCSARTQSVRACVTTQSVVTRGTRCNDSKRKK